jgi:hypothetical protein
MPQRFALQAPIGTRRITRDERRAPAADPHISLGMIALMVATKFGGVW